MKVLVAGGAGFLGAHLCRRLLRDGHDVVCVDNFHTSRPEALGDLRQSARFALVEHDVVAPLPAAVQSSLARIYNLACPASPLHYQRDGLRTLRTCLLGTDNLLQAARAAGARLLQASTSEIYGEPQVHPQTESYWGNVNPIGPRACYDEGKRAAETLCREYQERGATVRVARIFNTYGPGMALNDGRVVSNFVVGALRREALPVYGDGSQTRSFCYVDDLVEGLAALMESEVDDGPVNLGNPAELAVLDLARQVNELTDNPSGLEHRPARVDDPSRRRPDISRARAKLGWAPRTALRDGLIATIADFRVRLDL